MLMLQERVDDWMTNFSTSISGNSKETFRYSIENPKKSSSQKRTTLMKQIMEEKAKTETEALEERIKQREKEEARRERELILSGKVRPTAAQVKSDKILQIYHRVQILKQKANSKPKPKTASKWQRTALKLTSSSFKTLPMFPVAARESGEFNNNEISEQEDSSTTSKIYVRENPIHKSFAEAKNVDDLYKLAEFWLTLPTTPSYSSSEERRQ